MNSSQTRLDEFKQRSPLTEWQIVSVTFDNADVDVEIKTSLSPADPEMIEYEVLNASGPPLVFHDTSASRIAWSPGLIRLRSAVVGLKANLLLSISAIERTKLDGGSKTIAASLLPSAVVQVYEPTDGLTIGQGQYAVMSNHLILHGTKRLTLKGNGRLRLT